MKLSIITICKNDLLGLKKTVESVKTQSFKDFEFIIIDGASTDGTVDYLNENIFFISKLVCERDNGIYNAMNKGISIASGEYCLFLNAGDYLVNTNVLEKVFSSNLKEDLLYGNMFIETTDGKRKLGKMPKKISFLYMIEDTIWHPVSFIKRSLFERFGKYNENYKMVADYDFFLKIVCVHKVKTRKLNFPISVFNLNGFSSRKENKELLKTERAFAQQQYFTLSEIEYAKIKIEKGKKIIFRLLRKLTNWV